MKSIVLKKNISRRVESGHPWVFVNEVNRGMALDTAAKPGEIVDVYTYEKKFIGRGYANPQSQIMVRLLTRDKDETINEHFFLTGYQLHGLTGKRLVIQKIAGWYLARPMAYPS